MSYFLTHIFSTLQVRNSCQQHPIPTLACLPSKVFDTPPQPDKKIDLKMNVFSTKQKGKHNKQTLYFAFITN
uniref:Putative ovule protein n=1 Tax=Solanum chacoense TaxID=4108 RepID=A0A0V0HBW2_SOLCH